MSAPVPQAAFHDGAERAEFLKGRQWTREEERRLADLYGNGFSPVQLSRIFCRTVGAINGKLDYMLVPRKTKYRAWNIQEIRKAQSLRAQGLSLAAIGNELGRSGTSVRHALIDAERRAA